jgi:adenylate kinase
MINITILGYPGSGKSTNAAQLSRMLGVPHIDMGNVLREIARTDTAAGKEINLYIRRGELLPDDVATRIFLEVIHSHSNTGGFVFDGFPRTEKQAFLLDEDLGARGIPLPVAFYLLTDTDRALSRIHSRRASGLDRVDDRSKAIVEKRMEEEKKRVDAVVDYYGENNRLYICSADQPVQQIQEDIKRILVETKRLQFLE